MGSNYYNEMTNKYMNVDIAEDIKHQNHHQQQQQQQQQQQNAKLNSVYSSSSSFISSSSPTSSYSSSHSDEQKKVLISNDETNKYDETPSSNNNNNSQNRVSTAYIRGHAMVSLLIDGKERLCLAQISNTLLKKYSYNEIHNRRVALGINCIQCTPVQLEVLRRTGAMPISSRRCGMITKREAERLVKSFLEENKPPSLPENFAFDVQHKCGWGCRGTFFPARYNSSRAKCIRCYYCDLFYSPNKFIFHSHNTPGSKYVQPDTANFNSWRRHLTLLNPNNDDDISNAWEDVKAIFNGGTRKRIVNSFSASNDNYDSDSNVSENDFNEEVDNRKRSSQSFSPVSNTNSEYTEESISSGNNQKHAKKASVGYCKEDSERPKNSENFERTKRHKERTPNTSSSNILPNIDSTFSSNKYHSNSNIFEKYTKYNPMIQPQQSNVEEKLPLFAGIFGKTVVPSLFSATNFKTQEQIDLRPKVQPIPTENPINYDAYNHNFQQQLDHFQLFSRLSAMVATTATNNINVNTNQLGLNDGLFGDRALKTEHNEHLGMNNSLLLPSVSNLLTNSPNHHLFNKIARNYNYMVPNNLDYLNFNSEEYLKFNRQIQKMQNYPNILSEMLEKRNSSAMENSHQHQFTSNNNEEINKNPYKRLKSSSEKDKFSIDNMFLPAKSKTKIITNNENDIERSNDHEILSRSDNKFERMSKEHKVDAFLNNRDDSKSDESVKHDSRSSNSFIINNDDKSFTHNNQLADGNEINKSNVSLGCEY